MKASSGGIELAFNIAVMNAIIPVDQRGVGYCRRGLGGWRHLLGLGFMVFSRSVFASFMVCVGGLLSRLQGIGRGAYRFYRMVQI